MPVNTTIVDGKILYAVNINSAFANTVNIQGDSITGSLSVANVLFSSNTLLGNNVVANVLIATQSLTTNATISSLSVTGSSIALSVANNSIFSGDVIILGSLFANTGGTVSNNATITGGYIDGTPIGSVTPSTVIGTTITANTLYVGGVLVNPNSSAQSNAAFNQANAANNLAQSAYNKANSVVSASSNIVSNVSNTMYSGYLTSVAGGSSALRGDALASFDMAGNRINILKQFSNTATGGAPALMNVQLTNGYPQPITGYGLYPQMGAITVASYGLTSGNASLDGIISNLYLYGNSPYSAQDVAIQGSVFQYGHDSSWCMDLATYDYSGEPPQSFSQIGIEIDMEGNGPDAATSQYNPLYTYRAGISINIGTYTGFPQWTANTVYHAHGPNQQVGSVVEMNNPSGNATIYKCTTSGTSGNTLPIFPASGTVTDGTCVWTYQQDVNYQVGKAIWINGYGANGAYYGTGLATDGAFSGAVIDMSTATLRTDLNANAAGIRLASNMPIDFSGNGTLAGQNRHTMNYSSFFNTLYYNNGANNLLQIADTGYVYVPGVLRTGYGSLGNLRGTYYGYQTGLTVGVDYAGIGETDLMVDTSGISVYAVQSASNVANTPLIRIDGTGNVTTGANLTSAGSISSPFFYLGANGVLVSSAQGSSSPSGDNLPTMDFLGSTINFQRSIKTTNPTYAGTRVFVNNSSNAWTQYSYGGYQSAVGFSVTGYSDIGCTGGTTAVAATVNSNSPRGFGQNDVVFSGNITKNQPSPSWLFAAQSQDNTGLYCGPLSQWGMELDIMANGPDGPTTLYNPINSNRLFILLAPKLNPVTPYASNTHFANGTLMQQSSANGNVIFIAQNAGTTGLVPPTWNVTYGNTVTDGTITWLTGANNSMTVGCGILFGGANFSTSNTAFNTLISAGTATVFNAGIDFSQAQFTSANNNSAAIRLSSQQSIDFTGNGTEAAKNQRILQYNNFSAGLIYQVYGYTSFLAKNDLSFTTYGKTLLGASANSNLSGVQNGYTTTGITVGHNYNNGESDIIVSPAGLSIYTTNSSTYIYGSILTINNQGMSIGDTASFRNVNNATVFSGTQYANTGDQQTTTLLLNNRSSGNTVLLTTDGSNNLIATTGITNQIIPPYNSVYYFKGSVVARDTSTNLCKIWTIEGGLKKGSTAGSIAYVGNPIINLIAADNGTNTWILNLTTDTTNGSMSILGTGSVNVVNWLARINTTEVA